MEKITDIKYEMTWDKERSCYLSSLSAIINDERWIAPEYFHDLLFAQEGLDIQINAMAKRALEESGGKLEDHKLYLHNYFCQGLDKGKATEKDNTV